MNVWSLRYKLVQMKLQISLVIVEFLNMFLDWTTIIISCVTINVCQICLISFHPRNLFGKFPINPLLVSFQIYPLFSLLLFIFFNKLIKSMRQIVQWVRVIPVLNPHCVTDHIQITSKWLQIFFRSSQDHLQIISKWFPDDLQMIHWLYFDPLLFISAFWDHLKIIFRSSPDNFQMICRSSNDCIHILFCSFLYFEIISKSSSDHL